ncbi:NADH-cytochrome b5 reductase 2-like [Haemaphysalis longicornis]
MRPYTPVTHCNKRGSFDIMVKIYGTGPPAQFPNKGSMSQFLNTLRPGAKVQIQGPKGRFVYEGRGRFALIDDGHLPLVTRLGLVAAGTGVTPMLQLLRHILSDDIDQTRVYMIDVNTSDKDIIARLELDEYAKGFDHQFSICHVLSQPPSSDDAVQNYEAGPLSREIMEQYLPTPDYGVLVLCCGPPSLINDVIKPALMQIGYKPHQVLCY